MEEATTLNLGGKTSIKIHKSNHSKLQAKNIDSQQEIHKIY